MEGIARFLAKIQCVIKLFVKMANRICTLSTVRRVLCTKQFVGSDSVSLGCLVVAIGYSRRTGGDLMW